MNLAAPLHDIGKIGVSDLVLLKPGPLSVEQFEKMKEHSIIGSKILSGSHNTVIQLAEKIACSHHENWDGSGYPYGLKGEEIPLEARIVSVVDVYDALLSDRVYRKGLPEKEALDYIISMREIKFDPEVCDIFLKHIDAFRDICKGVNDAENEGTDEYWDSKKFAEEYVSTFSRKE